MSRGALFMVVWLVGCGAWSDTKRPAPLPDPAPAPVASAAPAPPPPPSDGCPEAPLQLSYESPRKIDTRHAPDMPWDEYRKQKWVAGHGKPPGKGFTRSDAQAIEAVIAVEAKHANLIPAPFRERVLAAPRDPALRLEIAACELKHAATWRRAAHDAALALLLGAPAEQALPLIEKGSEGERHSGDWCGPDKEPCAAESYCDAARGQCVGRDEHVHSYISDDELTIEDALTRALFRAEIEGKPPTLAKDPRGAWMGNMLHRCGKLACRLTDYEVKGEISLVVWDRRNGGSVQEVPFTKAERAQHARCEARTGFATAGACRNDCFDRYGSMGSAGWEAQDRCKAACDRACP